jgi:iron complex outermembrane recepter protein
MSRAKRAIAPLSLAVLATSLATVSVAPAFAQEEAAVQEESELVVTARRREESAQEVPISVALIDGDALRDQGITVSNDLQFSVPGLTFTGVVANRESPPIQLRGQGQSFGGALPGVQTYFAEVPTPGSSSVLYDMRSVEVLKGPQGTLFGRNTTGGALLYTPNRPVLNEFEGYVLGRAGNLELREVEAAVNIPIGDQAALRIAGDMLRREGYTRDLTTGADLDDQNRDNWRVSFLLEPTGSRFETLFTVTGFDVDQNGGSEILYSFVPGSFASGFPYADYLEEQQQNGNRTTWSVPGSPLYYQREHWLAANTTTIDFDAFTLRTIVGYQETQSRQQVNFAGIPFLVLQQNAGPHILNPNNEMGGTSQFSAEVQFSGENGPLQWLLGASYIAERPLGTSVTQVELFFFPGTSELTLFDNETDDYGVFAQGTWDLSSWVDGLSLTAGARYSINEQNLEALRGRQTPANTTAATFACSLPVAPGAGVDQCHLQLEAEFDAPSWTVSLDYQVTPDLLFYIASRRGFKAGGFNPTASNPANYGYGEETLTDVEIGMKADWRVSDDFFLRTNIAAFTGQYDNIQRFVFIAPNTLTRNAGDGRISGLEVQGSATFFDSFDLILNYAYTDATIDPFPGILDAGTTYANLPEHAGSLTARYRLALDPSIGDMSFAATAYSQSDMPFVDTIEVNPQAISPAYTLYNLRADWTNVFGGNFDLGFFVNNATDEEYIVDGVIALDSQLGWSVHAFGPPRTYGAEIRYNF